jgi:hypothetical protein
VFRLGAAAADGAALGRAVAAVVRDGDGLGLVGGVLDPVAISALVVLGGAAYACVRTARLAARHLRLVTGVLALALAMHKLPGFNNPLLLDRVVLSDGAAPFTLYANFDKGAVGLVLLALLCRRVHRGRAARCCAKPRRCWC